MFKIPFRTIVRVWIECEKNKRNSNSCTRFRWHVARDLVSLWHEMCNESYEPRASMCFMVTRPVLREVWAGAFRDRAVHHWEQLRYGSIIENYFVEVGDVSMNCRKGYGSLRAVRTFEKMLLDFTENYTRNDCWIVGGDFANFFMSIDKSLLWECLEQIINDEYRDDDKDALLYMIRTTLFHRCQDKYYRKSPECMWDDLPHRKSLFYMDGLPIGNLPSQIFANFIGAIFTDWINNYKKYPNFIIFVDDWRLLVRSSEEGKRIISEIKEFLSTQLHVTLHPNKIYLQHYTKGTKFVGAMIKPYRTYISNRTRGQFISTMLNYNRKATTHKKCIAMVADVRASINSYLGLMCYYKSYNVRRKICEKYILPVWGKYLYFTDGFRVCKLKKEYDIIRCIRKRLKNRNYAAKFIRPKWQPQVDE